jgi:hypothetical protein
MCIKVACPLYPRQIGYTNPVVVDSIITTGSGGMYTIHGTKSDPNWVVRDGILGH